jgi:hypothetical protein
MAALGCMEATVCGGHPDPRKGGPARRGSYTAPVPGQMYDPAVQRAVLEKLARWRHLPEGDLIGMLSPVERLRFRPEALDDLEWDGLVSSRVAGDERMMSITEAGEAWLQQFDPARARSEAPRVASEPDSAEDLGR